MSPASHQPPTPRGPTARERSRRRKLFYGVAIIALIPLLLTLSYPGTTGTQDEKGQPERSGQPGGKLAQYRDKHELSQTELGQIDPMSATIHLATLGMRGVGASVLWWNANEQQKKKDWTHLRATLDQISKFQPHSIKVWKHQAWNLSYNVSVAFDDYHDKFYWVIEGINFMLDGININKKEPRLYWDMGFFVSNKIGKADEAKYYRRLFAENMATSGDAAASHAVAASHNGPARQSGGAAADVYVLDNFPRFRDRSTPPTGFPHGSDVCDNWHVGKAWYLASESKIDPPRYPVKEMAEVIFYSDAPNCQFYYADNLEKDGRFDQVAVNAWKQATREWHDFGERFIDTSYDIALQLNRKDDLEAAVAKGVAELDKLVPGGRQKVHQEKLARLTPQERAAWNLPDEKRTPQQAELVGQVMISERMEVKDDEVARRASPDKAKAARKLSGQIERDRLLLQYTKNERAKVNFDFWKTRAESEQTDDCIAARQAIHDGDKAYAEGDQLRAKPYYEKGMKLWRKILDRYPLLADDVGEGGDLLDVIHRYQKCLDQDDLDLPKPFILQDIIDKHEKRGSASE